MSFWQQGKYKLSNYYCLKYTLNLLSSYQSLFYCWNEMWLGEMFVRRNVRSGKCHSGKCPLGKCPFRELSVWGTVLSGTVCRRTVRRGNVFGELSLGEKSAGEMSVGELSGYRWIVDGGVQNVWINISVFKFIIPQIN